MTHGSISDIRVTGGACRYRLPWYRRALLRLLGRTHGRQRAQWPRRLPPPLGQQMAEGWVLADIDATGLRQIQRSQNGPTTFARDIDAVEFVVMMASSGSLPHAVAFELHADSAIAIARRQDAQR